jgi:hypothetical protein
MLHDRLIGRLFAGDRPMNDFRTVLSRENRQLLIDELRWPPHAAGIHDQTLIGATVRPTLDIRPLARKLIPPHIPLLAYD